MYVHEEFSEESFDKKIMKDLGELTTEEFEDKYPILRLFCEFDDTNSPF